MTRRTIFNPRTAAEKQELLRLEALRASRKRAKSQAPDEYMNIPHINPLPELIDLPEVTGGKGGGKR